MTATLTTARAAKAAIQPTVQIERVTPATAALWLENFNTKNRNMRQVDVDRYARDMAEGSWQMTAEPIKFGRRGDLLDGQHRLAAIVKSGITLDLLVVRNVPDGSQAVMDSGRKRTAADALTLRGEQHAALSAAVARLALAVQRGDNKGKLEVSHTEVIDFLEENPDVREAVAFAQPLARRVDCTPTIVAYTTWTLGRIDKAAAYTFWIDAAEKVGLAAGDPVIALTNRFADARRNRERMTSDVQLSAIYRAWNARRAGQPLRLLKTRSSSGGLVPIPEPR